MVGERERGRAIEREMGGSNDWFGSFGVKAKDAANKETERVTLRLSQMIRICE
jgi:hypothetical protein